MRTAPDRLELAGFRLAAALLLGVTWIIPALNKLSAGGVPGGFAERFGGTFLASFPGIPASFYSIALLEAVAGLLAAASIAVGEFRRDQPARLLAAATVLSAFVFVQLGFGLRLIGDNDGAANLFFYTVGAFVILGVLRRLERDALVPSAD